LEEVLQRDSLLDIVHRFISFTNGKLIFPRYHQYDVVKKLIADVKENGAGRIILSSTAQAQANQIQLPGLHTDWQPFTIK
jgi:type I restriction enzyme R subunit